MYPRLRMSLGQQVESMPVQQNKPMRITSCICLNIITSGWYDYECCWGWCGRSEQSEVLIVFELCDRPRLNSALDWAPRKSGLISKKLSQWVENTILNTLAFMLLSASRRWALLSFEVIPSPGTSLCHAHLYACDWKSIASFPRITIQGTWSFCRW